MTGDFVPVYCPECGRRMADVQAPTTVRMTCPRRTCNAKVLVPVATL